MKTPLLQLICLGAALASFPVLADEPAAADNVQALPQIMPEQNGSGNCDSSNGGCKQAGDMRNTMSAMMHSAAGMAAMGGPGCKTGATQAEQSANSRMQAMQMMMGGMMSGMGR